MDTTELCQLLRAGAVALTPNRRLSAVWQRIYAQQQRQANQIVWPRPTIVAWQDWIVQLWQALSLEKTLPMLLDNHQYTRVWQDILRQSTTDPLLDIVSLANTAMRAWQLQQQWQLPLTTASTQLTEETRAYFEWQQRYQKYCQQQQVTDIHQIGSQLTAYLANAHLSLPKQVVLIAFTDRTPQQSRLLERIQQHGQLRHMAPPSYPPKAVVTSAQTEYDELVSMAHWAQHQLHQGIQPIACVLPTLSDQLETVQRVFQATFSTATDFDISASSPLAQQPLVNSALTVLTLPQTVPLETLYKLLHTRYLQPFDPETDTAGEIYQKLCESALAKLPLNELLKHLPKKMTHAILHLQKLRRTNAQPASSWVPALLELLQAWGWPGDGATLAQDQAVFDAFLDSLNLVVKLDVLQASHPFHSVITYLERICQQTPFHQAAPTAPVQVLGILEGSGQNFAAMWLAGMTDQQWPPAPQLNPMLPKSLQIQRALPHASAARELAYCQQLAQDFLRHNASLIVSYAEQQQDIPQNPSRLFAHLPQIDLSACVTLPPEHTPDIALVPFTDPLVPLAADEPFQGGSGLLQLQAACPFRAFAKTRLGAINLPSPRVGLDPIDRGLIVHQCLEQLWQGLKNHNTLLSLSPKEIRQRCEHVCQRVLQSYLRTWPAETRPVLQGLEQQRLVTLLGHWLAYEKQRPPFYVVAIEQSLVVDVGGIPLTIRVDRIDALASGGHLVIDYKTGLGSANDWLGERPRAPQLPLYALSQAEIVGIAFAQIRLDGCRLLGLSAAETNIPGIRVADQLGEAMDWPTRLQFWRKTFSQLLQAYQQGHAEVDPHAYPETCQYCELPSLCRIHEWDKLV